MPWYSMLNRIWAHSLLIGANKAESHPLYISLGPWISDRQCHPVALCDSMAIVWSRETALSEGSRLKK